MNATTGQNMNAAQTRIVDPILTDHARGYSNGELIGNMLFPRVRMPTRAAKRIEFNREALMRVLTARAPGTNVSRFAMSYKGLPVNLTQDALQAITPIEFLQEGLAVPGIDLLMESVEVVQLVISLGLEIAQAELARDAAKYDADNKLAVQAADKWSLEDSDPVAVVEAGKEQIRKRTGRRPNTLVLGATVRSALKTHPKVLDRFKHTTSNAISDQMLAQYFDLPNVYSGDAIYDDADGNTYDVWGDDAILAFVAPEGQRNMRLPSYGYTYQLDGHPFVEQTVWDNDMRSWKNNVIDERAPEIVGADAGYLIQGAV